MQQAGLVFIKYAGATMIGRKTENRQGLVSAAAPFKSFRRPCVYRPEARAVLF